MPLETIAFVADLNPANPAAVDGTSQGDDHLRGIKTALKGTFPNFNSSALASTQAQLDAAVAATAGTGPLVLEAGTVTAPGASFAGDNNTGLYQPAADEAAVSVGGQKALHVHSDKRVEMTGAASVGGTLAVSGSTTGPGFAPIGASMDWWSDTLPDPGTWGTWAWLNGQAISRTANAALFALWGTKFGVGDGSTTFNVPDTRERVLVGQSIMGGTTAPGGFSGSGLDPSVQGHTFGETRHTLTTPEIPAHSHTATVTDPGHDHLATGDTGGAGIFAILMQNVANSFRVPTDHKTTGITVSNANTGGDGAHNNVQLSIVCSKIVRIA